MKFLSGLIGLILAIGFSEILALPPPEQTPSPAPTPKMIALPIPSAAPTRAPENGVKAPALPVPPPRPAAQLPPPPIPPRAPTTAPPTALEIQRVTPAIEVWRAGAHSPQVPVRRGSHMAPAFIADNQPVMVRLQFDPLARGKSVFVRPGRGAVLDPPSEVLRIRPTGECVVTVRLQENAPRSHVIFHWKGFTARQINKLLGRSGNLWQRDYFDRLVRDEKHFANCVRYIRRNPEKARLGNDEFILWESEIAKTIA